MITLGIETSCDETSVSVVSDKKILSNIISSQWMHQQFGGVVPEISARAHLRLISEITNEALQKANCRKDEVDVLAVTYGPGLMGALLVGVNFAKSIAYALEKPLIPINHIESHLFANFSDDKKVVYPFIGMIVSGGHTMLVRVDEGFQYSIIGTTRDDAAGEAFDKVAKMLGLGYPGGPIIDSLSLLGDPEYYEFPRPMINSDDFDFSFSGLKTAVLHYIQSHSKENIQDNMSNICASVQKAIVDVLISKVVRVSKKWKIKEIVVAGGVSANSELRRQLNGLSEKGYSIHFPPAVLSTDNAAMVALLGELKYKSNLTTNLKLSPKPNLVITS